MAGIQDASGSNTAFVNTDLELSVALNKNPSKAGGAVVLGESHDGDLGLSAVRRSVRATVDKSLTISKTVNLWEEFFSFPVFNTRKYFNNAVVFTAAAAGGLLTVNTGSSTASGGGYMVRTYKTFQLPAQGSLIFDFTWALALNVQANNNIEIGWGIPSTATTAPLDGIYLSIDNAGAVQLVANYNGSVTTNAALTGFTPVANRLYGGQLIIHRDRAEIYIDGILYAAINRPISAPSLSLSQNGHLFFRLSNTAVTTSAQKLSISSLNLNLLDYSISKSAGLIAIENLDMATITVEDHIAVGQIANIVNSVAPTSATLLNTAAGYTTLGGNFQFAAIAGAETDYALFGFQVPVNAVANEGRNLIVTGVELDTWNMGAASATTPTLLNWYIGIGASAVSLATADTNAIKAPHRAFLGSQSIPIGTIVGSRTDRTISASFSDAPFVVCPGEFVHIILRMPVGTATAAQVIRGSVVVKSYWA
jgi:hypothetical protein